MNQTANDGIDALDYRNLMIAILNQSIDDYIKLQHPQYRVKVYLQEAFLTSIGFIFDDSYTMENLKNGFKEDMSTKDLLSDIIDVEKPNILALRQFAVKECYSYWEKKEMAVLDTIPDTVSITGMVFTISHVEGMQDFDYSIENKFITLDKRVTKENEQLFLEAIISIIIELFDDEIKQFPNKSLGTAVILGRELHWVLKVNNIFSYVGVPEASQLFIDTDESA